MRLANIELPAFSQRGGCQDPQWQILYYLSRRVQGKKWQLQSQMLVELYGAVRSDLPNTIGFAQESMEFVQGSPFLHRSDSYPEWVDRISTWPFLGECERQAFSQGHADLKGAEKHDAKSRKMDSNGLASCLLEVPNSLALARQCVRE